LNVAKWSMKVSENIENILKDLRRIKVWDELTKCPLEVNRLTELIKHQRYNTLGNSLQK
jgi:hypothetical protein